ncbi:target of SBF [Cytospora paraplurivora]|uniref:Target of SBF n=1 Tax=Cytospora paraplurivora TaxID=2898453 RepID=A0AAN9U8T8_9PEZI
MDSSPGPKPQEDRPASWHPDTSTTADIKRPVSQSQLLPPLDVLSSSPGLPNASAGRQSRPGSASTKAVEANSKHAYLKYPTPLPTSSTGILSSSPPRIINSINNNNNHNARPALRRVPSTVSERAPLSTVPSIELNENGDTILMGRSSNSSHYQLSANRLISRVHAKARYISATVPMEPNKVEIECNGWNGLRLHCQGRTYDLAKGDILAFETEGAEIMLDVQDARVLVHWPKRDSRDSLADLGWEDSPRSARIGASPIAGASPHAGSAIGVGPLRRNTRIASPESPTPAHASLQHALSNGVPSSSQHSSILSDLPSSIERDKSVEIYEDEDVEEGGAPLGNEPTGNQSFITDVDKSFSSDPIDSQSGEDDEYNPNEENDPVVHSFGPFGANINSRMAASFHVESPKRRRLGSGGYSIASPRDNAASKTPSAMGEATKSHRSSKSVSTPRQENFNQKGSPTPVPETEQAEVSKEQEIAPDLSHVDVATITNHVANQLAFSRLSSTPLSTIMMNLPAEEKKGLRREELKYIVESTDAIGTIERHGKDAEGKPLESQYYYIPEKDNDEHRRAAVVDGLRKPTLRNCRKHHVQYYWKRPRTP